MDESFSVGILIASIYVLGMNPVMAAIKTLSDPHVKWESVSERLVEQWRGHKKSVSSGQSSASVRTKYDFCSRPGHTAQNCWINLANPNNRLKVLKKGGPGGHDDSDSEQEAPVARQKKIKKGKKKGVQRASMAFSVNNAKKSPDVMMVDSGITSHMTAKSDMVIDQEE